MDTLDQAEKRLAVVSSWALWGAFGLCTILSGFARERLIVSLLGFALILAGLVAHVIINRLFRTGFGKGEVVVGFIVFGGSVLLFVLSWILDPGFGGSNALAGVAGFSAIIVAFVLYLVIRFGLKGSFSMFHGPRHD